MCSINYECNYLPILFCMLGKRRKADAISEKFLLELTMKCPNIEEFYLRHMSHSNLAVVPSHVLPPKLKKLSIISSYIPTGWFAAASEVSRFVTLQYLDLSDCSSLRDSDFNNFAEAKDLQSLLLTGCYRLTDATLIVITNNFKRLTTLKLGGLNLITDTSVQNLLVHSTALSSLDLTGCNITDEAFKPYSSLSFLSVAKCPNISNVLLTHLLQIKSLLNLDISSTSLTYPDCEQFKLLQPQCHIQI